MDRDLIRGSIALLILSLLKKEGPLYGYQITKLIQERSNSEINLKEGTLYPALYKLEEAALIESEWMEINGRKRRYYKITSKGLKEVEQKKREWDLFKKIISGVVDFA